METTFLAVALDPLTGDTSVLVESRDIDRAIEAATQASEDGSMAAYVTDPEGNISGVAVGGTFHDLVAMIEVMHTVASLGRRLRESIAAGRRAQTRIGKACTQMPNEGSRDKCLRIAQNLGRSLDIIEE